jgi:hypothetical protein
MVEFVGLIKVNVVKGTNLAIRDLMTSDPYVILSLGHQVSFFMSQLIIIIIMHSCNIQNVTSIAVGEDTRHKEQFKSSLE